MNNHEVYPLCRNFPPAHAQGHAVEKLRRKNWQSITKGEHLFRLYFVPYPRYTQANPQLNPYFGIEWGYSNSNGHHFIYPTLLRFTSTPWGY